MIKFIIGFVTGALFGMIIMSTLIVSRDDREGIKRDGKNV